MMDLQLTDVPALRVSRGRLLLAPAIAAALAAVGLAMHWDGRDLAGQVFRADLIRHYGFVLWNNRWYGGHALFDYSVIAPALGALVGPLVLGAASCVASAALFDRIVANAFGRMSWAGSLWFAASAVTNLAVGRVTFAVGVTFGLAAVLFVQQRHAWPAAGAAALCSLASPVAGVFVAIAAGAVFLSRREDRGIAVATALGALVPLVVVMLAFPGGGYFPYETWAYLWDLAVCAIVFAAASLAPNRSALTVRWGVALYALASTIAFAAHTALGENISRLGQYVAGPLLACLLWRRHRVVLALVALPLLFWQWYPAYDGIATGTHDPSSHASYYQPVAAYLHGQPGVLGRVEVLPTFRHWESTYLALDVSIARGWQRQLDMSFDKVFYGDLTTASYHQWLDENAVQYVALPDVSLDSSATAERALVLRGLPYLHEVLHTAHWRVWSVADYHGYVQGAGAMVALGLTNFSVNVRQAGDLVVRLRPSPHWAIRGAGQSGACVESTSDGWIRLRHLQPGSVTVVQALIGTGCS